MPRSAREKPDVIVYTMGKVGSSTVSASINAAGLYCLDAHVLEPDRLSNRLKTYLQAAPPQKAPPHIFDSLRAHNAIVGATAAVKIITLIRHPVARNISAVFQNLPNAVEGDLDKILARLRSYRVRIPDDWFDKDFRPVIGIDVFAHSVDRNAQSYRFANEKFDVLMLKLEADDNVKAAAIGGFVGRPVVLTRVNEAKNKWYADKYNKVRSDPALIRDAFEEECLKLKYFRHFYDPDGGLAPSGNAG